jgi:hypothetical protein
LVTDKYCGRCGEKQVTDHDFTLSHFVEETIEGITHFDNKFIRTIRLLLFSPGVLGKKFQSGERVRYMKPMQLFIVCNLLYFILVAGNNIFTVSLDRYLALKGGLFDLQGLFFKKFDNADVPRLTLLFTEKMISQSKAFIILFIPFYAIASFLFFIKKKKPFGLHLVFATHFFCFLLLFFTLFRFIIEIPNNYLFHIPAESFDTFAATFNFIALIVYFAIAAKNFYQTKWFWSWFTGIMAAVLFVFLLQAYRLFLFYKIIHSMH